MKNALLLFLPDNAPPRAVYFENPDNAKSAYREAEVTSGRLELWNSRRGRIKTRRARDPVAAVDTRPPGTTSAADRLPPVPVPGATEAPAPKRRGRPPKVKPADGAAAPPPAQEAPPPAQEAPAEPARVDTAEPAPAPAQEAAPSPPPEPDNANAGAEPEFSL